jgi:conjugative transposon TraN protein
MRLVNLILTTGAFWCLVSQDCNAQAGDTGFSVEAIGSVTIPVTLNKMTNIVFPTAINPGIRLSRDIFGERPKGTTNVLLLRANRRGFSPTNLSVYGMDGRLYSFELRYEENPAVLMFRVTGRGITEKMPLERDADIIEMQRPNMHRTAKAGKTKLLLQGIYLQDGLMWYSLSLTNHSQIAYFPDNIRWLIKDKRQIKRAAIHEIVQHPVYKSPVMEIAGGSSQLLITGLRPFTLPGNKHLVVEVEEKAGGRNLILTVDGALLLKLKRLDK